MKLYILNKKEFEEAFSFNPELEKKIHIEAFNQLKKSIDVDLSIPLMLTPEFNDFSVCILHFVNKKDNVYFYEFETTIR